MYKVHYILNNKLLINKTFQHIPLVGDEIRLKNADGGDSFFRVERRVFCLDELDYSSRDDVRVNIEIIEIE